MQDDVLSWTMCITTWRPHKKKQSRGRSNKAQVGWNENVIHRTNNACPTWTTWHSGCLMLTHISVYLNHVLTGFAQIRCFLMYRNHNLRLTIFYRSYTLCQLLGMMPVEWSVIIKRNIFHHQAIWDDSLLIFMFLPTFSKVFRELKKQSSPFLPWIYVAGYSGNPILVGSHLWRNKPDLQGPGNWKVFVGGASPSVTNSQKFAAFSAATTACGMIYYC